MKINLDIPYGEWRYLSDKEMKEINKLVTSSYKTFDSEMQRSD